MPEIQVKDKLITLEELGAAINAKAGVTSVNNQTGAVSITPANIGALAVNGSNNMHDWIRIDTSYASSNEIGISINMPDNKSWLLYPTSNGNGFLISGNDGTDWFWTLSTDMATKKVSLYQPLDITSGGTGANNKPDAISSLFDAGDNWISQYPNNPGIYRLTGHNIFTHMTPQSYYGVLVILKAVYGIHLYLDVYANMYIGTSSDTFAEPTAWRKVTSTEQS